MRQKHCAIRPHVPAGLGFRQGQEAMGVTSVHANRIVKQLRDDNVLEFHRGSVRVIDEQKLLELADFDGLYLYQRPSL
jgi:hypothetical protein